MMRTRRGLLGNTLLGAPPYGSLIGGGGSYTNKLLRLIPGTRPIVLWPLSETAGTNADNAEGSAARDGAYTGVDLANTTFKDGSPAGLWDGANDYVNINTASLETVFDGDEITIVLWCRVSGAGVWTDSTTRYFFNLAYVDNAQRYNIERSTVDNRIVFTRNVTGDLNQRNHTISTTDWFHLAITTSIAADEMKCYVDGVQSGATITGLAAFPGSDLSATRTTVGARDTVPGAVWDGYEKYMAIWDTPATAAQVASAAVV